MLGTDQTSTRNMIVDMSYGPDNDNIIFLLMQSDSLRLLKLLFHQYDLDVEKTNSYGYSVLHFAALYNAKRCARFLLKNHPTIRQKPAKSGLTPLHVAAGSDSFEVLKLLVEHNPSAIYVKDNVGRSIIHHTALGGYVNNIRYCIEKLDMDANEQAVVFDSDGQIDTLLNASRNCTPLHFAIEQGKLAVVNYLMSNPKVDFFIENSQGYTAITSVDSKGNTLLHQCVMHDNPDLLFNSILLGWEQVILVRNDFGETAFDIAISEGRVLCSCILLYFYVNVAQDYRDNYGNKVFECKDSYGNTLLHQTVNICSVNLVRKILSYDDVNLMSVNKNQETPLDLAIKLRNIEIISLLLADKRQRLIAKNGSSYVVKLMNYGLMTEEIYKLIKSRKLRKKRKLCYKLTISLVLSFMVVTSVVMACIVKFHKEINSIFAVVRDRLSPQLFFMLISGFILVSIFISCYLFGKLYIELMQRKKLLPIEISKIDSAKSTDSTSSINSEYIDVPSNGKQAPSDSNSRSSSSDTRSSSPQNSCNSLPTSNLELPMPNIELERRHSIDAIGSKGIIKHITSLEECRRLPQFTSLEECRKLPQCSNTLQRSLTLASLR
ncbi:ankyrin repeat domain-containing protein [Ehrlichia sp. JZT12]